jgi:hypothetical protein
VRTYRHRSLLRCGVVGRVWLPKIKGVPIVLEQLRDSLVTVRTPDDG